MDSTIILKIENVINGIRFIDGLLFSLLAQSNISPGNRTYIENRVSDIISVLESIKKDMEEEHDRN